MKKMLIEMLYEKKLKKYLALAKSSMRPEESDNYRNGSLKLNVSRDRNGEIEDKAISLYGYGMSSRDISDNIQELYGFDVSAETISNIKTVL